MPSWPGQNHLFDDCHIACMPFCMPLLSHKSKLFASISVPFLNHPHHTTTFAFPFPYNPKVQNCTTINKFHDRFLNNTHFLAKLLISIWKKNFLCNFRKKKYLFMCLFYYSRYSAAHNAEASRYQQPIILISNRAKGGHFFIRPAHRAGKLNISPSS